jgi:hypothetical protein
MSILTSDLIDDAEFCQTEWDRRETGSAPQPESWQLLLGKMKRSDPPRSTLRRGPPSAKFLHPRIRPAPYGPSLYIRIDVRDRRKNGDWKKPNR